MSSRRREGAVAGGLAAWAAIRLTGADRFRWVRTGVVPLISFTPQAAAGAWAGALLLRGRGAAVTAGLAAAALTAAVAPRAVRRGQPPANGPVLRLLTVNLRLGRAEAGPVVELARRTGADVLFAQELTHDAAARLDRAGLSTLMPGQVLQPTQAGGGGSGIYARHPLGDGLAIAPTRLAQPTARLDLPSGSSVQLVCVHSYPPRPGRSLSRRAVEIWRRELSVLPAPGDRPVILAGDFNATLDHAEFRGVLRRGYADAASQAGRGLVPTWGAVPRGRPGLLAIDHILADPRCAVRATSVHQVPGSDHRVLYAELQLPG